MAAPLPNSSSSKKPCWCGSGLAYRLCHQNRANEKRPSIAEIGPTLKGAFKSDNCLAIVGGSSCPQPAIGSHSISRMSSLQSIANEGHVLGVVADRPPGLGHLTNPKRIGIRRASVFGGFCAKHDAELFKSIDDAPLTLTPEQLALLSYRSISKEVFAKRAQSRTIPSLLSADRGLPRWAQRELQADVSAFARGIDLSLRDMQWNKQRYEAVLASGDFSEVRSYVAHLKCSPALICLTSTWPEIDFQGNVLLTARHQAESLENAPELTFALTPTRDGGAIAFTWLGYHPLIEKIVTSFAEIPNEALTNSAIRFAFEFSENLYWSEDWWRGLDATTQRALIDRYEFTAMPFNPRKASALLDDGLHYADWDVYSREESWVT
jgi:hypothetical protein